LFWCGFFPPNCSEIPRLTPADLRQLFSFAYPSNTRVWGENFYSLVPEQREQDSGSGGAGVPAPGRDPTAAKRAVRVDFSLFVPRGDDLGTRFFLGARILGLVPFKVWLLLEESGQTFSLVIASSPGLPVVPTGVKS